MKKSKSGFNILWFPRILTILFLLFLLLFSFDVFEMPGSFLEKIGGFLIHSLPSIIMAAILVIFWKKPLHAGLAYFIYAILFTLAFNTIGQGWQVFVFLSVPLFLIAAMYLIVHNRLTQRSK